MNRFPEPAGNLPGLPGTSGNPEQVLAEVPNYECPHCGEWTHIDDHKQRAPNWCESCDDIRQFKKLDEKTR